MRLTLVGVSLAALAGACRVDSSPSPPSPPAVKRGTSRPDGPLGGRFTCRTDAYPFVLTPYGAAVDAAPSQPELQVEPDRATLDALAVLAERGPLADRVERIAILLGLDQTSEPENIAWMIDRARATRPQITLVARLLEAANRRQDGVRVLSERAAAEPVPIAAELRRLGADTDAAEVLALAKRGR